MAGATDSRYEAGHGRSSGLIDELASFASHHKASRWRGTFAEFLRDIFPAAPHQFVRSSHQYLYDMLGWYRAERCDVDSATTAGNPKDLFTNELYGIDDALDRVVEYFKAASAGSDVGRRLLLLLGPPSGGKSSAVILMKRGLEEYSHTDAGALYALQGSPLHESPLNLIPASMRGKFRETYGVEIAGELSPYSRARLDDEFHGDFMQFPVERIFLSEASRVGVGTYAPHDPTTADIADLVGSVDLSKVAEIGDEGDPRAWSWSGAVYAASRGMLEMIEILKVKREFLYLLLTLTQEKNVKVSRFPLIHLDETDRGTHQSRGVQQVPAGEGERGPARSHGDREGPLHAVLSAGGAHLPQARLECAGVPRRAPRSARAQARLGIRDPHAPAPSRRRRASTCRRSSGSSPARTWRGSRRARSSGSARNSPKRACPA